MATDDSELLVPFPLDEAAAVAGADATAAAPSPDASVAAASAQTLPPLTEILHDTEHFQQYLSSDGKKRVKCLWCQHDMPLHATKLLHHAARIANKGVKICSGLVPKLHKDRYANLYEKKLRGANRKSGELIALLFLPLQYRLRKSSFPAFEVWRAACIVVSFDRHRSCENRRIRAVFAISPALPYWAIWEGLMSIKSSNKSV